MTPTDLEVPVTIPLSETVKSAKENRDILRFMRLFDARPTWQKLLLVHKKQLFESIEVSNKSHPLTWFPFDSFGDGLAVQHAMSTMSLVDWGHIDFQDAWLNRNSASIK